MRWLSRYVFKTSSMHNLAIGYNNGNAYRINFALRLKIMH